MTNVIPLRCEPEPDMVWHCACGCSTNYAHLDGTLECASCGSRHEDAGGGWRDALPEPTTDRAEPTAERTVVTDLNCPEMALKRVLAKATVADTVAVVLFQDGGGVSSWGSVPDTRRHRGWLNRKMATAKALLIERMA